MNKMKTLFLTIAVGLCASVMILPATFAQAIQQAPVVGEPRTAQSILRVSRPGALFMLITPDARTAGMGNANIATNPDATAVFYSPAKLPYAANNVGIHASYTPWFTSVNSNNSMYLMSAGGYYKFDKLRNKLALSASIRYFSYGTSSEVFQNDFTQTFQVKPFEISADIGLGVIIAKGLSAGVTGRFLHSDLFGTKQNGFKPANTVLADISLFYEKRLNYKKNQQADNKLDYYDLGYDKFYAGFTLANLSGKINYQGALAFPELPPTNISLGVGYKKVINEQNVVTVTTQMDKLLVPLVPNDPGQLSAYYQKGVFSNWMDAFKSGSAGLNLKAGAEYWYNDMIAGRTGFVYEFQQNGIAALTFGASLKYQYASFDFAYFLPFVSRTSIYNPLANTIRFGLSLYFK